MSNNQYPMSKWGGCLASAIFLGFPRPTGQTHAQCHTKVLTPSTRPTWTLDIGHWLLDIHFAQPGLSDYIGTGLFDLAQRTWAAGLMYTSIWPRKPIAKLWMSRGQEPGLMKSKCLLLWYQNNGCFLVKWASFCTFLLEDNARQGDGPWDKRFGWWLDIRRGIKMNNEIEIQSILCTKNSKLWFFFWFL